MAENARTTIQLGELARGLQTQQTDISAYLARINYVLSSYNVQDAFAVLLAIQNDPALAANAELQKYSHELHLHFVYVLTGDTSHEMPQLPENLSHIEIPAENFRLNTDALVYILTASLAVMAENNIDVTQFIEESEHLSPLTPIEAAPNDEEKMIAQLRAFDSDIANFLLGGPIYHVDGSRLIHRRLLLQLCDKPDLQAVTSYLTNEFDLSRYKYDDLASESKEGADKRLTYAKLSDVLVVLKTLKERSLLRSDYRSPHIDLSKK